MKNLILLIALLVGFVSNSQMASSMSIGGVEYHFVENDFSEYRTAGDYSSISSTDFESYVRLFVRDAIVAGEDVNLVVTETQGPLRISGVGVDIGPNSVSFLSPQQYSLLGSDRIGGTSWGSTRPGYRITINSRIWDDLDDVGKMRLMYHELGHAVTGYGHLCQETTFWSIHRAASPGVLVQLRGDIVRGIMATGECDLFYGGPGYISVGSSCHEDIAPADCTSSGWDFNVWTDRVRHLFSWNLPLGGPPRTSKRSTLSHPIHD